MSLLLFAVPLTAKAQEKPKPDPSAPQAQDTQDTPEPKDEAKDLPVSISLANRLFPGIGNNLGLSFGLYETYASNIFNNALTSTGARSDTVTAFHPRINASAQRRGFQFNLDYIAGYRIYRENSELNTSDHAGSFLMTFQTSRRTSFSLTESVSSTMNDIGFLPNAAVVPNQPQPDQPQRAFFNRQRILANSAGVDFTYGPGRNTRLRLFGRHIVQRYKENLLNNLDGYQVGLRFEHRLNKWLILDNEYAYHSNEFTRQSASARIHRLGIAGFSFSLRPTLIASVSGGVEVSDFQSKLRPGASVRAGITKTSPSTTFALGYHKGFANTAGLAAVVNSQTVHLRFDRRITPWLTFLVWSAYSRSSDLRTSRPLEITQFEPRFQFALARNLLLSLSGNYVDQRARDFVLDPPNFNRYSVSLGVEYLFASLGRR